MDFGEAIRAMKLGHKARRAGWNGREMHIYLERGYTRQQIGGEIRSFDPAICLCTAQRAYQPGWLASQADMLAEDWEWVE